MRRIADMDAADYLAWKVREDMLGEGHVEPPSEKELSVRFRKIIIERPIAAAQEQKPVALGIDVDPAAIDALKNYQRQLDPDGDEVGVSRQALDEVLTAIERVGLSASPASVPDGWVNTPDAQGLWWHWNGDPDDAPYPCTVLWSGTANKYFVCIKDIATAPFCDTLAGKWLHIPQAAAPVQGET